MIRSRWFKSSGSTSDPAATGWRFAVRGGSTGIVPEWLLPVIRIPDICDKPLDRTPILYRCSLHRCFPTTRKPYVRYGWVITKHIYKMLPLFNMRTWLFSSDRFRVYRTALPTDRKTKGNERAGECSTGASGAHEGATPSPASRTRALWCVTARKGAGRKVFQAAMHPVSQAKMSFAQAAQAEHRAVG